MSELAELRLERVHGAAIAALAGEIDVSNADRMCEQIDAFVDDADRALVLDLTETTYLDSAGVRLVFALRRRLTLREKSLRIVQPRAAPVRRILLLVDVASAVATYESRDAALAAADAPVN